MGWYGGTFVAVLIALAVTMRRRDLTLVPVVLLLAFIVLYAFHIRGYYEMESGEVSPACALRFSMNLMGLWSLAVGIGLGWIVTSAQKLKSLRGRPMNQRLAAMVLCALLFPVSAIATYYLRRDEVEDETISRVSPAIASIEASASDAGSSYMLTMDPLVVQMYAGRDIRIVDLESIDAPTLDYLIASGTKLILLNETSRFQAVDLSRYDVSVRRVLTMPSRTWDSGEGYTVSILEPTKSNGDQLMKH